MASRVRTEDFTKEDYDLALKFEKRAQEEEEGEVNLAVKFHDQQLFPTPKDPFLWQVKVRIGTEKESCVSLLHKFNALKHTKKALNIISACTFNNIPNCVYVEAFKEVNVRDAIKGLENFF